MTKGCEWLMRYLRSQFVGVRYEVEEPARVTVIDHTGARKTFGINLFGDILDIDENKIVAESDCPHDIEVLGTKEPTSWRNLPEYFG